MRAAPPGRGRTPREAPAGPQGRRRPPWLHISFMLRGSVAAREDASAAAMGREFETWRNCWEEVEEGWQDGGRNGMWVVAYAGARDTEHESESVEVWASPSDSVVLPALLLVSLPFWRIIFHWESLLRIRTYVSCN